jgi:uncharacterized protein YgiB involved in biofilm formation
LKRSEYIAIGAVGLLLVASVWQVNVTTGGAGIDDTPPNAQAFSTVDECRMASGMTPDVCNRAFAAVQQTAVADAPRFDNQAACEAQYSAGQCRASTWNGASVFVPALVGALVGRSMVNAGQPQSQPLYPPRSGPANCPQGASTPNQPECAPQSRGGSGSGGAWLAGRSYSTRSGNTVTVQPGSDARVRTTASRSGFGATGRSVSGGS